MAKKKNIVFDSRGISDALEEVSGIKAEWVVVKVNEPVNEDVQNFLLKLRQAGEETKKSKLHFP